MPATAARESTMISHIPVWVFFVLFALLSLGYRLSRTRLVRPGTVALIAFGMLFLGGFALKRRRAQPAMEEPSTEA